MVVKNMGKILTSCVNGPARKKKVLKLVHVTNFWSYVTYMAKFPVVACDHYGK